MQQATGPLILQTGTFCSRNKGDASMTLATYVALRRCLPDARITILCPYPELDRTTYPSECLARCSRRRPIKALGLIGRAMLYRIMSRCCPSAISWILRNEELARYCVADLVVDLSGDGLTNTYGIKAILSHLVPVVTAELVGTPVALIAQTIGPLGIARPVAKLVLNRAGLITPREDLTAAYLRRLHLVTPVLQTADMAFLLEPSLPERASQILKEEGVDPLASPVIGVTASALYGSRLSLRRGTVRYDQRAAAVAKTAHHVITKHHAHVLLIPHVRGPEPQRDDLQMAIDIHRRVNQNARCHVIRGNYRPEELKSLFARCALVITMRTHVAIAATSSLVPTIAVAYSEKTRAIMRSIGQEKWVQDVEELNWDELLMKIDAAWAERDRIRHSLLEHSKEAESRAWENIRLIRQLLAKKPIPTSAHFR